jgi:hypothetical protein
VQERHRNWIARQTTFDWVMVNLRGRSENLFGFLPALPRISEAQFYLAKIPF